MKTEESIPFRAVSEPVDGRVIEEKVDKWTSCLGRRVVNVGLRRRVDCVCDGTDREVKACIANQDNDSVERAFDVGGDAGYNYRLVIQECSRRAVKRLMGDSDEE